MICTYISIKLIITGYSNGLLSAQCQANTWTNADVLLTRPGNIPYSANAQLKCIWYLDPLSPGRCGNNLKSMIVKINLQNDSLGIFC